MTFVKLYGQQLFCRLGSGSFNYLSSFSYSCFAVVSYSCRLFYNLNCYSVRISCLSSLVTTARCECCYAEKNSKRINYFLHFFKILK